MDFANFSQWHKGLTIRPQNTDKPTVEAGDKLDTCFEGTIIRPVVLVIYLPPSPVLDIQYINTLPGKHSQHLHLARFFLWSGNRKTHVSIRGEHDKSWRYQIRAGRGRVRDIAFRICTVVA
jgi:hypothetical protein